MSDKEFIPFEEFENNFPFTMRSSRVPIPKKCTCGGDLDFLELLKMFLPGFEEIFVDGKINLQKLLEALEEIFGDLIIDEENEGDGGEEEGEGEP